jgi:hypothetical protein
LGFSERDRSCRRRQLIAADATALPIAKRYAQSVITGEIDRQMVDLWRAPDELRGLSTLHHDSILMNSSNGQSGK